MKHSAKFLLGATTIILVYFLWPRASTCQNSTHATTVPATIPFSITENSLPSDISSPTLQAASTQIPPNLSAERLAALHLKLRQWTDSQIHDPDDEEGRQQLLAEMLGLVTDENVVDVVQALSSEELNTPFGIGALHHWMRVDATSATQWLAARPESTKEQVLAVAEDWISNPDGLQQYLNELPRGPWKQNLLEQASSAALSANLSEAIKLAGEMDSGDAQTNLLRSAACKWISTDPDATLDWITSVSDQSLREQLLASAAQSYALTDPALSMDWLTSQVRSDPIVQDAACNILETWVSRDPISAADWVAGIPNGTFKMNASKIVFNHWSQIDSAAANAWAQNLSAN